MRYSIIIPVYNRPEELDELLSSLAGSTFKDFEVVVVEDGSSITAKDVVDRYASSLSLKYLYQSNSGPGLARNAGAKVSDGKFIVFLDSDTIAPPTYLECVDQFLQVNSVDAWGGRDEAMESFTEMQQAINYSMTSFFTTGGIRGTQGRKGLDKFYPRSFNMGISRELFNITGGFGNLRVGEDIDFSYRMIKSGFKTAYIEQAFVYHKRRNDRKSFFKQVFQFGMARVNLSIRHRGTLKLVHILPALFALFCVYSIFSLTIFPLVILAAIWFVDSLKKYRNINISFLVVEASFIQIVGYGLGFLYGIWNRYILKKGEDPSYRVDFL